MSFEVLLGLWGVGTTLYLWYMLWRVRRLRAATRHAEREQQMAYAALEQAQRQRDMHQRRADEFFELIRGVEGEADTWRRLYRKGMSQAGVAQNWLLRDLSEVVRLGNAYAARLRKHGEKAPSVQVHPDLKRFIDDFEQQSKAEVPAAPGHAEAERIEREILGPAALNEPLEAQSQTNDPA